MSGEARHVRSPDGLNIAFWVDGSGPPMVLVHGSLGDHTAWDIPMGELRQHFTTFAMDRRGFGASEDAAPYSIEQDFVDVATVVDAAAAETGRPVVLWGHSYGANCAMGAATITTHVSHLVLYEPTFGLQYPGGSIEAAEAALAADDREEAVSRLLIDVLEMSPQQVAALQASARWPNLLAGAHTGPREGRVEQEWIYDEDQFVEIQAPTLLISGTESPASIVAATRAAADAIARSTIHRLDGHGHLAHRSDPELVISVIRDFIATG